MILITGAAGFIGSNIAAELNEHGRADLVLVDWLGAQGKWRNIAKRRFADFIFPEALGDYLRSGVAISAVVHMGAISSTTETDADAVMASNFQLSAFLWRWCTQAKAPLIYASSAATYGDGEAGFADDDSEPGLARLAPLNLYAWSKHAFDRWAIAQAAAGAAPPRWAGLKFFNVYGPNEAHKGDMRSLVAKNFAPIAAGATVKLFKSYRAGFADGGQLRDFVYVKDCAALVRWFLERRAPSGLYNCGTGAARSFLDLMRAAADGAGKPLDVAYVDMPEALRGQYQYRTQADTAKLRAAGFDGQFHTLEQGVRDYVQTYLTAPDAYR